MPKLTYHQPAQMPLKHIQPLLTIFDHIYPSLSGNFNHIWPYILTIYIEPYINYHYSPFLDHLGPPGQRIQQRLVVSASTRGPSAFNTEGTEGLVPSSATRRSRVTWSWTKILVRDMVGIWWLYGGYEWREEIHLFVNSKTSVSLR